MEGASTNTFSDYIIERRVLKSLLLRNLDKSMSNFQLFLNLGFNEEFFTGEFRPFLIRLIMKHFKKYGAIISRDTLWLKLKKKCKTKDEIEQKKKLWKKIIDAKYKAAERSYIFEELKKLYVLRYLTEVNNNTFFDLKQIKEGKLDDDPEALIKTSIDKLTSVLNIGSNKIKEGDMFKDSSLLEDLAYQRKNPEQSKGIDTGIEILTKITNGWNPGEIIIVTGRPGQGKSILLMNFALSAYLKGKNVIFFTLEMPFRQQQLRAVSRLLGVSYIKLKIPQYLSSMEWDLVNNDLKRYMKRDNCFFVVDSPEHCTTGFIDNKITSIENVNGIKIDLVVVDPIYLMRSGNSQDKREKDDPVGMISGELKILAMKRGLPILSASQFNREGGKRHLVGKDPNTMDLSFSDRLAHNSDIILGITSDYNDLAQLHIMKFRDGMGPKIYLTKKFETMQFLYEVENNDKEEINKYIRNVEPVTNI